MDQAPRTYRESGVDLVVGDEASRLLFNASRKTWENRQGTIGQVELTEDSFSALRFIETVGLPDVVIGMNFDGVGTKVEIAERVGDHTTVAFDLFAMVCDDAARSGCEPVLVGSILDFSRISMPVVTQVAEGMVNAARVARVAVVNGEIAELGGRVAGYGASSYNWGAAVLWLARRDRIISGERIRPGDGIVSLRERGLRSNGISLVRAVCGERYGQHWHARDFNGSTLGRAALEPSTIYSPAITRLVGGVEGPSCARLHGVVHVTGGGIPGKLARLLAPTHCGAILDRLFEPCSLMQHCQSLAHISDDEAYRTWNMGNGLLIVTPDPDLVLAELGRSGYEAKLAGSVTAEPVIKIKSMGVNASENPWLLSRASV